MSDSENTTPTNEEPAKRFAPRMGSSSEAANDAGTDSDAPESGEVSAEKPVFEPEAAAEQSPATNDAGDDEAALAGVGVTPAAESDATTTVPSRRSARKDADSPKRGPVRPAGPKPLGSYAIIETGGKQYRVSVGDTISVEHLEGDAGSQVTFDQVLMIGGDGQTVVGTPTVEGASVTATIDSQYRGEKIVVFKFKPKKRYRRRTGHRQSLTRLAITGISA